jgi:mediator of RNA polymerase II transcription subunit 16
MSFAMSDGSIEFRFRDSMELASADGNYEEVSTLPQFGFVFAHQEPSLHIALSPNYCCAVTMNNDGKVRLRRMECGEDLSTLKEDQREFRT